MVLILHRSIWSLIWGGSAGKATGDERLVCQANSHRFVFDQQGWPHGSSPPAKGTHHGHRVVLFVSYDTSADSVLPSFEEKLHWAWSRIDVLATDCVGRQDATSQLASAAEVVHTWHGRGKRSHGKCAWLRQFLQYIPYFRVRENPLPGTLVPQVAGNRWMQQISGSDWPWEELESVVLVVDASSPLALFDAIRGSVLDVKRIPDCRDRTPEGAERLPGSFQTSPLRRLPSPNPWDGAQKALMGSV